jgi:hypothetical protein
MITRKTVSRPLTALCALAALVGGIALTAAPAAAQALIDDPFFFDVFMSEGDDAACLGDAVDTDTEPSSNRQGVAQDGAAARAVRAPSTTVPVPTSTAPSTSTPSIIMKDGNICDPIRHMGC